MEPKSRTIDEIRAGVVPVSDSNILVGDYVFACKFQDAQPTDRWWVDYVERIDGDAVYFTQTGVIPYRFAQKITDSEGRNILTTWEQVYP